MPEQSQHLCTSEKSQWGQAPFTLLPILQRDTAVQWYLVPPVPLVMDLHAQT